MEFEFNQDKFKELVLYIAEKSETDPWFGATKLNKLLFYSDFLAYGYFGKPITGAVYQKLEHGPAPKKLLPLRAEMIREGSLGIRRERMLKFSQKRPTALRSPDVAVFDAEELDLVDRIIRLFCDRSASEVSRISHDELCWQLAGEKEEIPYQSVFLSTRPASESHFARGRELAESAGL
ncbi:MAG TPA: Panacea domain-containing protein [Gaiellaceae bacterium]